MSFLVIPISLGVAAGPLIGALLSNEQLFTNTSLAVPLYFCAGLALINLLVLQRSFRETYVIQSKKINIAWRRCITVFTGFNQKNMIAMGMAFMFMQLSWSFYFNYITLYLVYKFNATSLAIGIFFSLQGLGFTMGSLLLVRFFLIYFSLLKASIFCGIIASFSILFSLLAGSENMVWIWGFVFAMACAAGYSMQLSLFSELVGSDRQGWVMGIAGSIGAVSWGGTALLTGIIASYSMSLPLLLTFVCMLFMIVASIVYSFYKKKRLEK